MPLILFDFDGTLADTAPLMRACLDIVLPRYGIQVPTVAEQEQLRNRRPQEWMRQYGVTWWKMLLLVRAFRKEQRILQDKIYLYEGIPETLLACRTRGYAIGIVTSNATDVVRAVLQRSGITTPIQLHSSWHVFGKHRVITHLARQHRDKTMYIGDETRDIEAAHRAGVPSIAVSWGFNTSHILAAAKPDRLVDSPTELLSAVTDILET